MLDMRLEDYRQFMIANPVLVGISCMSGLQIKYALKFARYVREQNPDCLIVGVAFIQLCCLRQTASNYCVDVMVRGEGELVIKDLANKLARR